MNLSPTDLAAIAGVVLAAIYVAAKDDQRWFRFFRRWFSRKRLPTPEYDHRAWHRIAQDQWKRGFR